jgi:hypothetical protein
MSINIIETNMDDNNNMNNNMGRNNEDTLCYNKERSFIMTDVSDDDFEENFSDKDYYDMYVKNPDFNIMEMAKILILFPEHLYSIIKVYLAHEGINKKEIRGYEEYKEYIKNHNSLCREIYFYKHEELRLESEIENLIRQKQIVKEEKIKKKNEYNLFMIEKMGSASLPNPEVLKI